ncbi:MAG: polyphosphate:AMP phosphotransferase [Phycisphaera sp.]|nr:polyphosphate:AMP phosphotransferase [Phycisphaera sp.]
MFEAVELGRFVKKSEFEEEEGELRTQLLEVQRALRATHSSVVVIVSGVEGAGKSDVVNRLTEWLDTRGVRVSAFWFASDEEQGRPRFWRFWRCLPARGTIGVLFGSWYTEPIVARAMGEIDDAALGQEMERIESLERMLAADGAIVVKLWFHLSKKEQSKRLKKLAKSVDAESKKRDKGKASKGKKTSTPFVGVDRSAPLLARYSKHYDDFVEASESAIRMTDAGVAPWHLIEATNARYRDLAAGRVLLDAMRRGIASESNDAEVSVTACESPTVLVSDTDDPTTVLDTVDLSQTLDDDTYKRKLKKYQSRIRELSWELHASGRSCIAMFEGWDAGGKGGAIRRITSAVDARLFQVIPIAAPTDEERAHHYLWRFWRHVPMGGRLCVFDRSWYGRVLVERVEGFTPASRWRAAYQEINEFEQQLVDHGIGVAKFWIHISKDEQLRRFEDRQRTPWKQHKITDEDWRNREKWGAYEAAVNDMVAMTSTSYAPWTLVAGNDKRFARVQVVKTMADLLERTLDA